MKFLRSIVNRQSSHGKTKPCISDGDHSPSGTIDLHLSKTEIDCHGSVSSLDSFFNCEDTKTVWEDKYPSLSGLSSERSPYKSTKRVLPDKVIDSHGSITSQSRETNSRQETPYQDQRSQSLKTPQKTELSLEDVFAEYDRITTLYESRRFLTIENNDCNDITSSHEEEDCTNEDLFVSSPLKPTTSPLTGPSLKSSGKAGPRRAPSLKRYASTSNLYASSNTKTSRSGLSRQPSLLDTCWQDSLDESTTELERMLFL